MKALEIATTQPWAILPSMLNTLFSLPLHDTEPEAMTIQRGRPLEQTSTVELREGVAILPVIGVILRYPHLFSYLSGATSIERLAADFTEALNNPEVKAILLHIDSPGGTVAGVNEFAEMIYAARKKKPILAYISGIGASAAYWIASSADEIVMDATASVGSLGVVSVHTDETERKAKAGIKDIHIVSSLSPRKNPDLATDVGYADIQAMVDSLAHVFFEAVARHRHVTTETVCSHFGQGSLKVGIDAVQSGMADSLGSLESVITRLSSVYKKGVSMTNTLKSESKEWSVERMSQEYPTLVNIFRKEGALHERQRIQAVEAQLIPGHEALIHALKFDGDTSGSEAAVKVLAAEKQSRMNLLAHLKADAPPAIPMPSLAPMDMHVSAMEESENFSDDEVLDTQWRQDAKVRAEFSGRKETFMAFMKAQANGQVRILQR